MFLQITQKIIQIMDYQLLVTEVAHCNRCHSLQFIEFMRSFNRDGLNLLLIDIIFDEILLFMIFFKKTTKFLFFFYKIGNCVLIRENIAYK